MAVFGGHDNDYYRNQHEREMKARMIAQLSMYNGALGAGPPPPPERLIEKLDLTATKPEEPNFSKNKKLLLLKA